MAERNTEKDTAVNEADISDSVRKRNLEPLGATRAPSWLTPDRIAAVEKAEPLPFPDAEYERRLAAVRERLAALGAEAILVVRPSAVEYLCGYHTAETAPQPLLVTEDDTFLYVMDLEIGRSLASTCTRGARNILYSGYDNTRSTPELITAHVRRVLPRGARLALEFAGATTSPHLIRLLGEEHGIPLVDGRFLVENLKLVLSPAELRCMEEAARVTQHGLEAACAAAAAPGARDATVAAALAQTLTAEANSVSAWGPLVVTEPRSGIPHSSWKGDALAGASTFLEFAGTCHRYHTPVMRTLTHGRPGPGVRRLADLAQTALAAVLDNARPGVPCSHVAEQALSALGPLREDEVFHHMLGYPVGLAHPPHWMDTGAFYLTTDNPEPLQPGMAFHVPASFRSFGHRCVGLSHTFVVEEEGARVLTRGSAELIEV